MKAIKCITRSMDCSDSHPGRFTCIRPTVIQTFESPVALHHLDEGTLWVDFGKAMFATVRFRATTQASDAVAEVHMGEKRVAAYTLDRQPPGTVRYRCVAVSLKRGTHDYQVQIPSDARNTCKAAILMPVAIGEVLPFRYCEIQGHGFTIDESSLKQVCAQIPFDEQASHFECSDPTLNAVWELCKHTIKATTFCGVYVDGDRERIPYEGDAYINQLSHYCTDSSYQIARYTHEYLMQYPTWFSDWNLHSVMMAWADYLYTGQTESLSCFYEDLKVKTLIDLAGDDGLISTVKANRPVDLPARLHLFHDRYLEKQGLVDLVDWPPGSFMDNQIGERDNHEMLPVNTVVNALHYQAVTRMSQIAQALGHHDDAQRFAQQAYRVNRAINQKLFDPARGVYVDGQGSNHASLHANVFPLAFGLVPANRVPGVLALIQSRGMACSVYVAQYLLECLYDAGAAEYALSLMTTHTDRSWWGMIEQGTTMTLEAWAHRYKSNLDWNHAWGSAPANIIPRKLMGIEPILPGFAKVRISPQPASLTCAYLKFPTPRGPIEMRYHASSYRQPNWEVSVPENIDVEIAPEFAQQIQVRIMSKNA